MLGLAEEMENQKKEIESLVKDSVFFRAMSNYNTSLMERTLRDISEYWVLVGKPDIKVIEGYEEQDVINHLVEKNLLIKMNDTEYPNSYLYRSAPFDVARSEKDTYICTRGSHDDVGPTNYWLNTDEAIEIARTNLEGAMKGKTLYIVPYWLGPIDSPFGQGGIELTDSLYVVLNLMKITRVGRVTAKPIALSNSYVLGMHATADLNPEKRYILHFPDENDGMGTVISFNTNYGGNALLSKKCHALRIASFRAKREGWMAEHMMMIGIREPTGRMTYISGAFPSSSGKTNLSMLQPPDDFLKAGWDTYLVSDDITWMHPVNGQLRGINPEYGFFGVAPHTSYKTNPRAMDAIKRNTLFTNVGIDSRKCPYWEGMSEVPEGLIDWRGKPFDGTDKAAHPNSRFSTPIKEYRNLSPDYENPNGAPVSAFLFGGRRSDLMPLIMEARSWDEGVLFGAMQRVETTAAAIGKVGELRNDPMAMRPFMPYNMGDYFKYYLEMGKKLEKPPRIYNVNWFRKNESGGSLWPGYSQNMYVVKWILGRVNGEITDAVETPMGYVPSLDSFDYGTIDKNTMNQLLLIDRKGFLEELKTVRPFFESFGSHFPDELWETYYNVKSRLEKW